MNIRMLASMARAQVILVTSSLISSRVNIPALLGIWGDVLGVIGQNANDI